jgi:hypothetical protein
MPASEYVLEDLDTELRRTRDVRRAVSTRICYYFFLYLSKWFCVLYCVATRLGATHSPPPQKNEEEVKIAPNE